MKISKHFTTSPLTAGLTIALMGSVWLYGAWVGFDFRLANTVAGLLFFYGLFALDPKEWFWSGFFIGALWFWWIGVSMVYYHMAWATPLAVVGVGLVYGAIFWAVASVGLWVSAKIPSPSYLPPASFSLETVKELLSFRSRDFSPVNNVPFHGTLGLKPKLQKSRKESSFAVSLLRKRRGEDTPTYGAVFLRGVLLLGVSYLHPLGFDWFKPELVFVHSYLGVAKWQFGIVLLAIVLAQWRRNLLYLGLVVLAYSPVQVERLDADPTHTIKLVTTHITIADKWNPRQMPQHAREALSAIDAAITEGYTMVILPESVLPFFLNHQPDWLGQLLRRSYHIRILIGALYDDHGTNRNATYLFDSGRYKVANKVLLVPFGEANPLPKWMGNWVNKIFFDGAVDYIASADPTDWMIHDQTYRNAICYEATSERLYEGKPKNMIVMSNNGWFSPSVEPTFQRLLLSYYVRKYSTTIYHAANMSPSYVLKVLP
jgi:apolipoprotein N-acyltransferase